MTDEGKEDEDIEKKSRKGADKGSLVRWFENTS
jgi:hypothetical protein